MVLNINIFANLVENLGEGLKKLSVFTVVEGLNVLLQVGNVLDAS